VKGISHFASGLCVASCVPGVVTDAAQGGLLIALGGAAGLLPDFLDFRFARFLERRDADITPTGAATDQAQHIAAAFAAEVAMAARGTPRVVQLHPLRLGVDGWVTFRIAFESTTRLRVAVATPAGEQVAEVEISAVYQPYDGVFEAGELGGPSLRLASNGQGAVAIDFLPWHRTWSHSLMLAAMLGVAIALAGAPLAGIVAVLGFAVHVLEDQLGYLGSNLFWPLTHARGGGLGLLHAGDTAPNLLTVWLSLAILVLNLDRAMPLPAIEPVAYVLFALILPAIVLVAIHMRTRWSHSVSRIVERARELAAEDEGS
jgi:membrane-bound metal-dependent hydrolase YbcI (DUF457 family)